MALLYETGIRMSELIALKVEDVNGARRELRVYGKGRKERMLPILPSTLEEHHATRHGSSCGRRRIVCDGCREFSVSVICLSRVNHYLER